MENIIHQFLNGCKQGVLKDVQQSFHSASRDLNTQGMTAAVSWGQLEIVQFLSPFVLDDTAQSHSQVATWLTMAVREGYAEIVAHLLTHLPEPLRELGEQDVFTKAVFYNHTHLIDVYYPQVDVKQWLDTMAEQESASRSLSRNGFEYVRERKEREEQRALLTQATTDLGKAPSARKL